MLFCCSSVKWNLYNLKSNTSNKKWKQLKHYFRVDKEDEFACLIKGCNFLLKNISCEAFEFERHGNPEYKFQKADPNIFPYMLVNIGSGVSILKVSYKYS